MKKLIKSLPALGLVLAAAMAFAFNMPNNQVQSEYGFDLNDQEWYDVTGIAPGTETYQCNQLPNSHCLYAAPEGAPISGPQNQNRQFVRTGDLDVFR